MHRAVFFDRDNTLIVNDGDLGDPDEVKLMRGAAAAVASLRGLGYRIIVVTNQGGVARGKYSEEDVEVVHERVADLLLAQTNGAVIDGFYYCPFHPEGTVQRYRKEHPWRKPQPGMLLQAAEDFKLDLSMSWMIGDAARDIEAGHRAGVRTVMVGDRGDAAEQTSLDADSRSDFTAQSLVEAARIVAQQMHPEPEHGPSTPTASPPPEKPKPKPAAGMTYPATERLETTQPSRSMNEPSRRPFKPWSIQPRTPEDDQRGVTRRSALMNPPEQDHARAQEPEPPQAGIETPGATGHAVTEGEPQPKVRAPRSPEPLTPTPPDQPTVKADAGAPPRKPSSTTRTSEPGIAETVPGEPPAPAELSASTAPPPPLPPSASPVDEAEDAADEPDDFEVEEHAGSPRRGDQVRLLRQILRELRYRRAHEGDWSLAKMFGLGIAQPMAAICAVLAILNFGQVGTLIAWLLGAVFLQLLVLTLMLLHWQR